MSMGAVKGMCVQAARKAGAVAVAAIVAASLSVGPLAAGEAHAAASDLSSAAVVLNTQATIKFAASSASSIKKAAVKNAKAIVKAAKATSGTDAQRLERIYSYIATPKTTYGGTVDSTSYFDYYMAAKGANKSFYAAQPRNLEGLYKKFAIDAYKNKKASCYHYASLFAIAAKQALGKGATVKVAVGPSKHTGALNPYHAWTEVTIGKVTYIYDTSAGNYYVANVSKDKADFGPYCGSKKSSSKMKKVYQKFNKGKIGYAEVTL